MNNGRPPRYASIDEAMQDAAKYAVSDAASERLVLDYSWESVSRLEDSIDELFEDEARRTQRYFMAYGAYLAEVVRRRYQGSWGTVSKLHPNTETLTFCTPTGVELWPHARVVTRVEDGAENNLYHYLLALEMHIEGQRRDA